MEVDKTNESQEGVDVPLVFPIFFVHHPLDDLRGGDLRLVGYSLNGDSIPMARGGNKGAKQEVYDVLDAFPIGKLSINSRLVGYHFNGDPIPMLSGGKNETHSQVCSSLASNLLHHNC